MKSTLDDQTLNHQHTHPYRLDPRPGYGWSILSQMVGWMLIITSPFIAFAINGKVAMEDMEPAVAVIIVASVWQCYARWRYRTRVPKEIRLQFMTGKVFPVLSAGQDRAPLAYYAGKDTKGEVLLSPEGIFVSSAAYLRASWKTTKEYMPVAVTASREGLQIDYTMQIPWSELMEWRVQAESDGPNYYELIHRNGEYVRLRRPKDESTEPPVLDWVRRHGQCPVRLFTDIA